MINIFSLHNSKVGDLIPTAEAEDPLADARAALHAAGLPADAPIIIADGWQGNDYAEAFSDGYQEGAADTLHHGPTPDWRAYLHTAFPQGGFA